MIKYLQTYQAVRFNKTTNTYFLSALNQDPGYGVRATKVLFEEREHGVLVYDENCAVLVGWANIGSLEYERKSVQLKSDSAPKAESKPAKVTSK
jgi:hypothetical protein